MSFKKVVMFVTSDGKQHKDEEAAKIHEITYDAKNDLYSLLKESFQTGRPDSVLSQILMECDAVRDILARMNRRLPRKKKKEEISA